jgi:hypothetical protein
VAGPFALLPHGTTIARQQSICTVSMRLDCPRATTLQPPSFLQIIGRRELHAPLDALEHADMQTSSPHQQSIG